MSRSLRTERHKRLIELIIAERELAGLRQVDVAERLGRQQPFVSNIENGQRRVDVVEFLELAEVVGFDAVDILRRIV